MIAERDDRDVDNIASLRWAQVCRCITVVVVAVTFSISLLLGCSCQTPIPVAGLLTRSR